MPRVDSDAGVLLHAAAAAVAAFVLEQAINAFGGPPISAGLITFVATAAVGLAALKRSAGSEMSAAVAQIASVPAELPEPPGPVEVPKRQSAEFLNEHFGLFALLLGRASTDTNSVIDETEAAASEIFARLKDINTRMDGLLAHLAQAGDSLVTRVQKTEATLGENRRAIDAMIRQRREHAEELTQKLAGIGGVTNGLAGSIDSIREIAASTKMLAINVMIEGARSGVAAKGLSAIASEVKDLARRSDEAAQSVRQGLEDLKQELQARITSVIALRSKNEQAELASIVRVVDSLSREFESIGKEQADVVVQFHREGEAIAGPIYKLLGSIQFQDVVRQRLAHLDRSFKLARENIALLERLVSERDFDATPDFSALRSTLNDEGPAPPRAKADLGLAIELF